MSSLPPTNVVRKRPFDCHEVADTLSLDTVEILEEDRSFYARKATLSGIQNSSEISLVLCQGPFFPDEGLNRDATAHVVARYNCGAGPRLKLLREGTFRNWLKQFGYEDIEVGDRSLDFSLTIKGEPEELVRTILNTNASLMIDYVNDRYGTLPQSDGETIEAKMSFSSLHPEKGIEDLTSLVHLLSVLASTDFAGLSTLRELPGVSEHRSLGIPAFTIQIPTRVDFVPVYDGETFRSRARTQLQRKLQPFNFNCKHVSNVEKASEMQDLAGTLRLFADARIVATENELSLTWPTVISDTDVLLAGATLLARMASPEGQNAYR